MSHELLTDISTLIIKYKYIFILLYQFTFCEYSINLYNILQAKDEHFKNEIQLKFNNISLGLFKNVNVQHLLFMYIISLCI